MKHLIFCLIFSVALGVSAQRSETRIYFNDGTVVEGYGKLQLMDNRVKFKENGKSSSVKYHFKEIAKLQINEKGRLETYFYMKIAGIDYSRAVKQVVEGEVSLFTAVSGGYSGFNGYSATTYYYIKRSSADEINLFVASNGPQKLTEVGPKFFPDCSPLLEKIKDKTFKKSRIAEIVNYYNDNCL